MIATIIPYFLLASVPNNSTWPTGPEFKFGSSVEIKVKDLKGPYIRNAFDIYNELTCRPKTETSITCKFQHKNMTAKDVNEETGETRSEERVADYHKPFYFEVGFDKKGVKEITLNEKSSKYEPAVGIAKAMANGLNVGTDLSGVQLGDDPKILSEIENVILEKCKGEMIAVLHSSSSEEDFSGGNWSLNLAPPLGKLEGRNIFLSKNWNTTDCKSAKHSFWLGMFLDPPDLRSHAERIMNFTNIDDLMTVSPGMFISASGLRVDVIKRGKKQFELQEISTIYLDDIQPAAESWPAIENPLTMNFNGDK